MLHERPWLTFWHWSSVTPYTSSYEFAGSCVFGKQLPGRLSLRPHLRVAGLIPKVRPIFCRVPWSTLTRSPCSTRADHLCRFAVRSYAWLSLEVFLGELFTLFRQPKPPCTTLTMFALKQCPGFSWNTHLTSTAANPIKRQYLYLASLHRPCAG